MRVAYKIYKDSDDVDVEVRVFLGDVDRIVKLKIPFLTEGHLIGQTAYATEPLFEDARENVAHRFVALEGGERFPALLNTDVYGSHFENNTLYMSLVRGVTYCAHPIGERPLLPSDRFTKKIDQGESVFSFRLTVTDRASLERRAQAFTQKPYALNLFPIPREDCHAEPFAVWLDGDVSCTAIKKADGRDAILFRLFNNNDTPAPSALEVNGVRLALHFGKYEVKTVLWENGALCEVAEMII